MKYVYSLPAVKKEDNMKYLFALIFTGFLGFFSSSEKENKAQILESSDAGIELKVQYIEFPDFYIYPEK